MLDPAVAPFVPQLDVSTLTLAQMRSFGDQFAASMKKRALARVIDRTIEGPAGAVPLRIYYPDGIEPAGLIVFLHGGGWCMGSLETHDAVCRDVTHFTGFAVGAVDYRLAPEHKFPAGLSDAVTATGWLLDHAKELGCDPDRVAIMGESAGANLAAVVAQKLKQRQGARLSYQVLVFPLTDFTLPFDSYVRHAAGPGLTTEGVKWCAGHYLTEAEKVHPDASPYRRPDLDGAPPAFILTAEVDPLCDDGEAYGRRLVEAGVRITMKRYLGLPHGFLGLPLELEPIRRVYEDLGQVLRRDVGPSFSRTKN